LFDTAPMRSLLLSLLVCCCWVNISQTDYGAGAPPAPHIFSSGDGEKSLKVVPIYEGENRGKAKVTLFRLDRDGSEVAMREFVLDDAPEQVLLPDSGIDYFVAINGHRDKGFKNAIVICHSDGRVVRVLELEDFLSTKEIGEHVQHTISSRRWRTGSTFKFDVPVTESLEDKGNYKLMHTEVHHDKAMLNIAFVWGKQVSIELATGKIISP
jgi:hypothetical protein